MEILNCVFALFITIFMGWFAWESSIMVDEMKRRRYKDRNSEEEDYIGKEELTPK